MPDNSITSAQTLIL